MTFGPIDPTFGAHQLQRLKAMPARPGQASFFYFEARLNNAAVKVLPGEYFVDNQDILLLTTLGSCISVCLWDKKAKVGGMNHFMLPGNGAANGRYGTHAMDGLLQELYARGATRTTLEAKVFGGGAVLQNMSASQVGELNTRFALEYLHNEHITIASKDVLDTCARRVCFMPASGRAMVKRLPGVNDEDMLLSERLAAQAAQTLSKQMPVGEAHKAFSSTTRGRM